MEGQAKGNMEVGNIEHVWKSLTRVFVHVWENQVNIIRSNSNFAYSSFRGWRTNGEAGRGKYESWQY